MKKRVVLSVLSLIVIGGIMFAQLHEGKVLAGDPPIRQDSAPVELAGDPPIRPDSLRPVA